MRRLVRALCVATLAGGLSVVALPAARAADDGLIRVAHLSPDTPAVDVYVGPAGASAAVVLRHVSYGTFTGYRHVAPGSYTVAVRAAGAATTVPPVLAGGFQVDGGSARTVAVTGSFATATLTALPDTHGAPPMGQARLRVIDASAAAASLDLSLGGSPVARHLTLGAVSGYVDVPAGSSAFEVATGTNAPTPEPASLTAGSMYSVVVLDRAGGGLVVRTVLDAAGPQTVPVGGVETGAGGTAPAGGGDAIPVAAALAALGLFAARRSCLVRVMVLVVAGTVPVLVSPHPPAPPAHAAPTAAVDVLPAGVPAVLPARVRIPAVGVDSDLGRLGTDAAGALIPPADFTRAGWFAGGPAPGTVGPAVIAGHVDSFRGPAVFFRLHELHSGDAVEVTRSDGTRLTFTVTRVARYAKTAFPTSTVYGPTADPELRLITCGGAFDSRRRSYVDDVVVFARLS